jgi:hypothetical protein
LYGFVSLRDSVSITLSGALIVRLKLEPGTGKTAALAVTQAKERLQSAVAVVQEMDIVRGRVPSRSRVASSVGAIRSRFRECMEDYTASVAAVNRLLQQTTVRMSHLVARCIHACFVSKINVRGVFCGFFVLWLLCSVVIPQRPTGMR